MTLMNGSTRARYASSISNANQGGGSKKAGLPHQIGRESWESVALGTVKNGSKAVCSTRLACLQVTLFPNVRQSLPVGFDHRIRMH